MGERPTPERIAEIERYIGTAQNRAAPARMITAKEGADLLAEIEALRADLARVEGEKDAALADCRVLAAELHEWRRAYTNAEMMRPYPPDWYRFMPTIRATDASGALTRHAKGGGA